MQYASGQHQSADLGTLLQGIPRLCAHLQLLFFWLLHAAELNRHALDNSMKTSEVPAQGHVEVLVFSGLRQYLLHLLPYRLG